MRIVLTIVLVGGSVLLLHLDVVVFLWDTAGIERRASPLLEAEVDALVDAMSLEEKVAQMHGVGQMRGSVNRRLDVPALLATDGPHGVGEAVWRYLYRHVDRATAFPVSAAIASSWNPALAQRVAGAIAREARAKGRNWLLAPALDIVRDPRAGRAFEGFGEDPHLSGRLGVAYVRGVQREGVVATPKHFVSHNQESFRRHIDVRVGERALREIYLPPFEDAVIEGEAWSIMAASHSVNGHHCTEHLDLLDRILKGEWGFRGFVVSDWDATVSTASSLRAGLDMEMPYGVHYGTPLLEAVRREQVAVSGLDDAVRRILRIKARAGLFERAAGLDSRVVNSPEHRELALEAARESIVLLRNDEALLPLRLEAGDTLAVLGPRVHELPVGGRGSSSVRPFEVDSPLDALRATAPPGVRVESPRGAPSVAAAASLASRAKVAVVILGLNDRHEGEALDRVKGLALPQGQARLLNAIVAVQPNVVLVSTGGSALHLRPWANRVAAILHAWYPGERGGQALAEIIFGSTNPSAKLPITFPLGPAQLAAGQDFPQQVVAYEEGIFVGYRHFDAARLRPLFPFGHGLSYTEFEYSDLTLQVRGHDRAVRVRVAFNVRNTGTSPGAEIAQLYVRDVRASLPRPPKELRGFTKVHLAPGEMSLLELELDWRDLAFFDPRLGDWRVEPGAFLVLVGSSSRDIRLRQRFRLTLEQVEPVPLGSGSGASARRAATSAE